MNHLNRIRIDASKTLTNLAELTGLSRQAIRKLETEESMPTLETARRIASALGKTIEEIWPPAEHHDTTHAVNQTTH